MKKFNFLAVAGALSLVCFAGCKGLANNSESPDFGRLVVSGGDSSRAMNVSDMAFTKVSVTGYGFSEALESTLLKLENGSASAEFEKVPVKDNCIVTAYAYDKGQGKLGSTIVRNIKSIKPGANSVSVNKTTTALGNVFAALLESGYDISSVTESELAQIGEAISSEKSWALVDSAAIAEDFKKGSLGAASSYVLQPGYVTFTNYKKGCSIQIGDPVSSVMSNVAEGSGSIQNVAPGTWPVYITDADGVVEKSYVTVKAGKETAFGNIGHQSVTDKIIVHLEVTSKYNKIYAWSGESTAIFGAWPGKAMTDSDNDGWYDVVIEATSVNLIFNGDGQTSDLSREEGEWWYKDNKWYDENPDDAERPELLTFESDKTETVSGNLELTVSAADNKSLKTVVISVDGKTVQTLNISGKNADVTYILDTADLKNGSHEITCVVYDAAGNVSDVKKLSIITENENKIPVAVISGSSKVTVGKTITLSAADSYDRNGTVKAYKWTVTGAVTASGTEKTITINAPSTVDAEFTVTLMVQDNDNAWSEAVSHKVTVKETSAHNDFREETIYFLMTARWYDGDSSNNRYCRADDNSGNIPNNDHPWRGDFKGLIEKLDYIKAMGFTAVWITPPVLNRSDYDYHGYHAWNMNKIDPRLESAGATYQDLIDACHAKGLKIIQDIVLNHSSRYGLEDLYVPKYWGDRDNKYWGTSNPINYYDEYNPDFTYNGIDAEPKSGKTWYNGDLWQKEKPDLWWNPDLSDWGLSGGYNNEGREWYKCQWPTLKLFDPNYYHTGWLGNWEDETCQTGTIHEDCIDLDTEKAAVQKYLIDAYSRYIEMGVDAFRVDTVKHINRVMFNRRFNPAFMEAARNAGNDNFFMFGEVCTKVNEVWNKNNPSISAPFYTWKESQTWSSDDAEAVHECYTANCQGAENQPVSNNHYLNGNTYHAPDYSQKSDLGVIDFAMHMNFTDAGNAYGQRGNDKWYNDATWNVTYVESHDYSPDNGPANDHDARCTADDNEWAEDMSLLWTFRGIPCLFQGSEIRFKAGVKIDAGPTMPLEETGRAYYGTNLEGTLTATDFSEYTNASGKIAETMNYPLVKHLRDLNKIRRAIPALQKGQYSNDDCNGGMCFKRRFTDDEVDSFVVVTISSDATFNNLPGGTYVDVITGDKKVISEGGSITTSGCSGQGNLRVYVNTSLNGCQVTGKIAGYSPFLK